MPFEAAHAQLALARVLASEDRAAAARAASEHAAAIFRRLGAGAQPDPAAERGGATPARSVSDASTSAPLTARERDVLKLVAAGLADKEIADRLGLSPHTIHRHVSNILARLDLPSRSAAVAHAARLGLLD